MPRMHIIGLTGKAGSGKDTTAAILLNEHMHGLTGMTVAFAKPIKEAAKHLFMLEYEQLHGSLKETVDPRWGMSPRQIMQWLGTDVLRQKFGDDFFLKHMRLRLEQAKERGHKLGIITDVRFDNEAELVRDMGGRVVHIVRPGVGAVNAHVSENGVNNRLVNAWIVNDWTVDDLKKKVRTYLDLLNGDDALSCMSSIKNRKRRAPPPHNQENDHDGRDTDHHRRRRHV